MGPPPATPGGVGAPGVVAGEGVGTTATGPAVGFGAAADVGTGDGRGLGTGRGDGLGAGVGEGVGVATLIVNVAHAGVDETGGSVPHTWYEPGRMPFGGAVEGVELVHRAAAPVGAGLVAQSTVLPNDQETTL